MHRLFVALRPPPSVRRILLDAMGGVPGARWQDEEQLHLTLRFIGEVDGSMAEDVAGALHGVRGPRPSLAIAGAGAFDRKGITHTLWAGIAVDGALKMLQQRVDRVLQQVGLPSEPRTFHPHVTLARLGRGAGPIEPFLASAAGLTSPAETIDAVLLYESRLGHDGATYKAIMRYPLDQG